MDMNIQLKADIMTVEMALERYFSHGENLQKTIYDAMGYSLFAGGKRIRPVLMLAFCRMCGGLEKNALPFACGLEMIHTYSLIHDDLPCMDDDDLRRGKPTNHKVYGEAAAVLAGDGLLNRAFETMLRNVHETGLDAETVLNIMACISHESGSEGMVGGQVIDLESERQMVSLELLRQLEDLKTGALFRAACMGGVMAGGGSDEQLMAARTFASALGLAFQIQDDILDVEGDEDVLGKPVGSDTESGKSTFVSLMGLAKAKEEVRRLTDCAKKSLQVFDDSEYAVWLAELMVGRSK